MKRLLPYILLLLLTAWGTSTAATISVSGVQYGYTYVEAGPTGTPRKATVDYFWFTVHSSGSALVNIHYQGLPTNMNTVTGLSLRFYREPDSAAQTMSLLGSVATHSYTLTGQVSLEPGRYLAAVLPRTTLYSGGLPLPAVEAYGLNSLVVRSEYAGTLTGDISLEEIWRGQPDGTFVVTSIPEPSHYVLLAGLSILPVIQRQRPRTSQSQSQLSTGQV